MRIDISRDMHMVSTKWWISTLIRQERQIVSKKSGAYVAQIQTGEKKEENRRIKGEKK